MFSKLKSDFKFEFISPFPSNANNDWKSLLENKEDELAMIAISGKQLWVWFKS